MEEEIWRDVVGYEGLYRVSNHGQIYRNELVIEDSIGRRRVFHGHILTKYSGRHGYDYVTLSKDGKERSEFVQRIVAKAFIFNDDQQKTEVNHIDENKKNNNATNLEWVTSSQNKRHGTSIQRMLKSRKEKGSRFSERRVGKYTVDGILIAEYKSASEAARQNGIEFSCICSCCRDTGPLKTYKGFVWKYLE